MKPYNQLGAYGQNQKQNPNNQRDTDKMALLRCASKMREALDKGPSDMKGYVEAIQLNQRLWTIFQVALADPANPLSIELKNILLNLSRYVDKTSFRVITEFKPDLVESLISINRSLASGLAKEPPPEAVAEAAAIKAAMISDAPPPTSLTTSA
ncbi:MAG: hypothetical protein JO126_09290 [Alphaproteobacteria bacterium]|nr:hypothetical protein [Alphaproteobacteria bacterium]MBV8549636.1 hypothetical protein [Alphaproteobacteria bacterium]